MIVDVLHELLSGEHLVILQRLPTIFIGVVGRVEDDAMRMQVRVERSRRVVFEERRDDIAGCSIGILADLANASARESLQFAHRRLHRLPMRLDDAFVTADEGCDRNRFWGENVKS